MTLLPERDLTPEEREAIADEPRPGVWVQDAIAGARGSGDGRALSQEETDNLIGLELLSNRGLVVSAYEELRSAVGRVRPIKFERFDVADINERIGVEQRGGIASEPLIRLLAFRAWGDRDRRWFRLRQDCMVYVDEDGYAVAHPTSVNTRPIGWAQSDPKDGVIAVASRHRLENSLAMGGSFVTLPVRR